MARFIPPVTPEGFNGSDGERKVYEALKGLSDRYTVFYSFEWVGLRNRTQGEADFVIVHPDNWILVVEVKAGGIAYRDGTWQQVNRSTGQAKDIDPFTQARRTSYEIRDRLIDAELGFWIPDVSYCVWFTSVDMSDAPLPPEASREFVLDNNSLADPEGALGVCYDYWKGKHRVDSLESWQYKRVIDALCPQFRVIPRLKTKVEEAEESYIRLTRQQAALLDFLEEQDTAVVHGLAGTGKTVLAVEKAKRLAAQGQQVLFLCFNRYLRLMLKEKNPIPGVTFHNAHSLARAMHARSDAPNEDVLEEFEDYLELVYEPADWPYHNVIVDEGQDLDDRLLNRLYELVRQKGGCFYVFYDRNQRVLTDELPAWIEDAECRLVLHRNCRNTAEVFSTSCAIMGLANVHSNEIHGDKPIVRLYKSERELEGIVSAFLKRCVSEGLSTEQVVILTTGIVERSWIDPAKTYAGVRLSEDGEAGSVHFTTVRKFKGLEAEAILVIDTSVSSLARDDVRRRLYVGSSRAKNFLCIALFEDVGTGGYGDLIRKMAPERHVPKNGKGLVRLLNASAS